MDTLFLKLHRLSMKAHVRSIVETSWGVKDDPTGKISEMVLGICNESISLDQFRQRISSVGVDPWNSTVGDIFRIVQRMKSVKRDFEPGSGNLSSQASAPPSRKRLMEYEEFQSGENITGISADSTISRSSSSRVGPSHKHMVSDYDLFEAQQLRKAGSVEAREYISSVGEDLLTPQTANQDTDSLEVVLREAEPAFLRGHARKGSSAPLQPVSLVKDPSGTLQKAAMNQVVISQERREAKDLLKDKVTTKSESTSETESDSETKLRPWKSKVKSSATSFGPRETSASIAEQRKTLPIFQLRESLMKAIEDNQILILIGETGSGKTTQLTQYLIEDGYGRKGVVGCTQPRRISAISVAKRVSQEFGCRLGDKVGYSVRFDDTTSASTIIRYMTDGMLLREVLVDPDLSKYSVIILDEAHERTVSTDVLFGLCKKALKNRPELKLIVTSATLEAEKFSQYFYNASIFRIPGRTFPVEVFYANEQTDDYVEAALATIMHIHFTEEPGDILVFLTGQEEIDMACEVLHARMKKLADLKPPPLIPLPVYSALPSEMQTAIFEPAPPGCRKCVIATNIAEASITIDGIVYVVDPGFAKIKTYNAKAGMDSLIVTPISQASARQRAGRAGRSRPGRCYRLYTERAFETEMLPTAVPELQRSNLSNVVLMLKAMGIDDVVGFDFMDKPPVLTIVNSLETLWLLGALDDEGSLTKLGRRMAEFPMAPEESKMLLASVDLECADDVITIVAMLSVQTVFYRPRDKMQQADERKRRFISPDGDHITLLEVFRQWQRNGCSSQWCYENYIVERSMKRAMDVRKQLISILEKVRLSVRSAERDSARIRKAICAGYFNNACKRDSSDGYKIMRDDQQVFIHPSSVLYQRSPQFLIYHELVQTTREYIRDVCIIEPQWLPELAPNLFAKADSGKLSKAKQVERIKPLFNKFEDESVWRLSKRYQR